jgi:hypothetical protein
MASDSWRCPRSDEGLQRAIRSRVEDLSKDVAVSSWVKKGRIYVDMVDFGRDSSPQLQNSLAPV